jgi:para-aminobenzoate synthetase component 1
MEEIRKCCGRITDIYQRPLNLTESFEDFASRFSSVPGSVVLLSGGELDCARYHILAAKPWLTFSGYRQEMVITTEKETLSLEANPFAVLHQLMDLLHIDARRLSAPVGAGLFGYFSYDLKDSLEDLPKTSVEQYPLPHICLFAPSMIIVQDKKDVSTQLMIPMGSHVNAETAGDIVAEVEAALCKPHGKQSYEDEIGSYESNFTQSQYVDAVNRVKDYISAGDVYQVNLSQRFQAGFAGDPYALFRHLFRKNPAPFFAYVHGGNHHILSTSPERFIWQSGRRIETRPIKGTRPRGRTRQEDRNLKQELEDSDKDEAELSMIVDLLRNDMGRVCIPGSINVKDHKRVEAYQNVYHLVSIIEGLLGVNFSSVDLIAAVFPGGSITGCPKIRAMEIIDELEPTRRHVYTGAIGYVSFHDTMDLSIAIRTATLYEGRMIFSVGGGIVADSDPRNEYDETLHKGQTLLKGFKGAADLSADPNQIWFNGALRPANEVSISVRDEGFLFGYGFFETIRAESGQPHLLATHISRFNKTWETLFCSPAPDLTWDDIIQQTLKANNLTRKTAAVKILATMGENSQPPFRHNILVMAKKYQHRLEKTKLSGLRLVTYPHPRQSPLADHKTLNYLYYLLAGRWAAAQQADEALILNPDGSISETNTANVILIQNGQAMLPGSAHVLPGVMLSEVVRLLSEWGYDIVQQTVTAKDLIGAEGVFATNSLLGAVPVLSLDGRNIRRSLSLERKIQDTIFRREMDQDSF